MDKNQAKATKIVVEPQNEKRRRRNVKHPRGSQDVAKTTSDDIKAYRCRYCPKAFLAPKYVIRHMIRRHSDVLLTLHDQNYNFGKNNKAGNSSQIQGNTLIADVNELKQCFMFLKQNIGQLVESIETSSAKKSKCHCSSVSSEQVRSSKPYRKNDDRSHDKSTDFIELNTKCKAMEETVQDLNRRYDSLLDTVGRDMQLKEALAKRDIDVQKVSKELKMLRVEVAALKDKAFGLENQLTSFKSSISSEMQHQNLELGHRIQLISEKCSADIQNLCAQLETHLSKVDSNINEDIAKRFDQCLKHYLNQLPKPEKRLISHAHATPVKRSGHNVTRRNCSLQFKRAKSWVKRNPDMLDHFSGEVEAQIAARMEDIGLNAGCSQLSSSDFSRKNRLIKTNAKFIQSRYKDYSKVKQKVEQVLDSRTHMLLKRGAHCKHIKFSSPESSESDNLSRPSTSSKQRTQKPNVSEKGHPYFQGKKNNLQNSFEFLVSSDPGRDDLSLGEVDQTKMVKNRTYTLSGTAKSSIMDNPQDFYTAQNFATGTNKSELNSNNSSEVDCHTGSSESNFHSGHHTAKGDPLNSPLETASMKHSESGSSLQSVDYSEIMKSD